MFPTLNPPPSSLPIPFLWVIPVHQPQASTIVHRTWTGDSFHTWYYTCFNAILPNLPTLSLSHRVHKTDLPGVSESLSVCLSVFPFLSAHLRLPLSGASVSLWVSLSLPPLSLPFPLFASVPSSPSLLMLSTFLPLCLACPALGPLLQLSGCPPPLLLLFRAWLSSCLSVPVCVSRVLDAVLLVFLPPFLSPS